MAWNRELTGGPAVGYSALEWSVPAMRDAIQRLALVDGSDRAAALALISDAVWAVTMVDAAMVRYYLDIYDRVLDDEGSHAQLIEEGFAGLRFVRNQMQDDVVTKTLVGPGDSEATDSQAGVSDWSWKPVTERQLPSRRPTALTWELARYRAYQSRLAGHRVGQVFEQSEAFLQRIATETAPTTDLRT